MSLISAKSKTEDDRQRIIIEFIRSKPYCNAEDVVQGVKNDISRVTVFKVLRRLVETGAVKIYLENEQKRNARDHKLFVDEGNPLVSVRLELEEFESAYFDLFDKEMHYIDAAGKSKDPEQVSKGHAHVWIVQILFDKFYFMVDAYLFRFLYVWSYKISDRRVLQQLYSMVFSKIGEWQTRISESLVSTSIPVQHDATLTRLMQRRFRSFRTGPLEPHPGITERFGKQEDVERIIDSLWNIIGELQPYVYPEPRQHGWPFKYQEDDWRKLLNLLKKHRIPRFD